MAQRIFQQFVNTLEKQTVRLLAVVTATATQTGDSPQTLTRGKGIASVTAAATGVWTINLQDPYFFLLGCDLIAKPATPATAGNITGAQVLAATDITSPAQKVVLQLLGGVNGVAATAPATGDVFYIELVLSNSTAL